MTCQALFQTLQETTKEGQWISSKDCGKTICNDQGDLNEECVIYGIVFVSVSAGSRNREIDICMPLQVQAELKVSLSTVIGETRRLKPTPGLFGLNPCVSGDIMRGLSISTERHNFMLHYTKTDCSSLR